jgi:hypothetical protein
MRFLTPKSKLVGHFEGHPRRQYLKSLVSPFLPALRQRWRIAVHGVVLLFPLPIDVLLSSARHNVHPNIDSAPRSSIHPDTQYPDWAPISCHGMPYRAETSTL